MDLQGVFLSFVGKVRGHYESNISQGELTGVFRQISCRRNNV